MRCTILFDFGMYVQGDLLGCRTGNGEKLSSSQAEQGQAIKSAVT